MNFTGENTVDILNDINNAYKEIGEKYNIILSEGPILISAGQTKFTTTIIDNLDKYKKIDSHFIVHCDKYGLKPEAYQQKVKDLEDNELIITSVSGRKQKYGVTLVDKWQKEYNMSKVQVRELIINSSQDHLLLK